MSKESRLIQIIEKYDVTSKVILELIFTPHKQLLWANIIKSTFNKRTAISLDDEELRELFNCLQTFFRRYEKEEKKAKEGAK